MSDWNIKVNENSYRENKYRVSVGNFDTLEIMKVGTGPMGSAQHGVLDREHAKQLSERLHDEIQWGDYEQLTDALRDEIRDIENDIIESFNQQ